MKATRFITVFILLALVLTSFSLAAAANPPTPTPGTAVVNTNYDEWDWEPLNDYDFFAHMYEAGDPINHDNLSDLFLRYDCETSTLFALMLAVDDYLILQNEADLHLWIKDSSPSGWAKLTRTAYGWSSDGKGAESSYDLTPGSYIFKAHVNIQPSRTSQTITEGLELNITCLDYGDLPDESGKFSGYTLYENGARHVKGDLFLGGQINVEVDGKPDEDAAKDEFDDGIVPIGNWGDGTGHIQYAVTGEGCLYGWLDYMTTDTNGGFVSYDPDYSFDGVNAPYTENIIAGVPVSNTNATTGVIDFDLPDGQIQGNYYARFRLFDAEYCDVGLAADLPMYQGSTVNGEVEDYFWTFGTNAVSMAGFSASAEGVPSIWVAVVALISMAAITGLALVLRRQAAYETDKS